MALDFTHAWGNRCKVKYILLSTHHLTFEKSQDIGYTTVLSWANISTTGSELVLHFLIAHRQAYVFMEVPKYVRCDPSAFTKTILFQQIRIWYLWSRVNRKIIEKCGWFKIHTNCILFFSNMIRRPNLDIPNHYNAVSDLIRRIFLQWQLQWRNCTIIEIHKSFKRKQECLKMWIKKP